MWSGQALVLFSGGGRPQLYFLMGVGSVSVVSEQGVPHSFQTIKMILRCLKGNLPKTCRAVLKEYHGLLKEQVLIEEYYSKIILNVLQGILCLFKEQPHRVILQYCTFLKKYHRLSKVFKEGFPLRKI